MSKPSARASGKSRPAGKPRPKPDATPAAAGETDEIAEQLAKSAEILFGGLKIPEGADLTDRKLRLTLERAALRHHQSVTKFADTLGECIGKQVDADNEHRERQRKGEEGRMDDLVAQEIRERETARIDGSRERNVFIALAAITVICTLVLALLSAMHPRPWLYTGSGVGLALSAASLLRLRALSLRTAPGAKARRRGLPLAEGSAATVFTHPPGS